MAAGLGGARDQLEVTDAGESVLPDGPMPAEPTVEMLEAETLEIMRRLVRLESRRAPLEGTN